MLQIQLTPSVVEYIITFYFSLLGVISMSCDFFKLYLYMLSHCLTGKHLMLALATLFSRKNCIFSQYTMFRGSLAPIKMGKGNHWDKGMNCDTCLFKYLLQRLTMAEMKGRGLPVILQKHIGYTVKGLIRRSL